MDNVLKRRVTTKSGQKIFLVSASIISTAILIELILRAAAALIMMPGMLSPGAAAADGAYRILCLGESTTGPMENGQGTWPDMLGQLLDGRAGRGRFIVVNGGVPGTQSSLILADLEGNIERNRPDIVVTMIGVNDERIMYRPRMPTAGGPLHNLMIARLAGWIYESLREPPALDEARSLIRYGRFNESISLLSGYVSSHPGDSKGYSLLAYSVYSNGSRNESEKLFLTSLELDPGNAEALRDLAILYHHNGREEECVRLLLRALSLDPEDDLSMAVLASCNAETDMPDPGVESAFSDSGYSLADDASYRKSIIKRNYLEIHRILREHNVVHIAMQYPLISLSELEDTLDNRTDIIFVGNDENFRSAMMNLSYDDLFVDRFAGDFGHATSRGNLMIAQAAADAILRTTSGDAS